MRLMRSFLFSIFMVAILMVSLKTCNARKVNQHGAQIKYGNHGDNTYNNIFTSKKIIDENSTVFNVLDYGAKGDGISDDTKAFEAAWEACCKVNASRLTIPSGSVFLVGPISFSGQNCQPDIVFQLDGKIIAPTSSEAWGSGLLEWIEFTKLERFTIKGKGVFDGQGSVWWNESPNYTPTNQSIHISPQSSAGIIGTKMPSKKPTAVRFYGSNATIIMGITIQNSPQTHLKFDNCTNVQVFEISISSPGDSPNTDGIHLQNSRDVVIFNSNLSCGDDCVSIQTGCSNVYIHNIKCGPGHGISIGSLGRDKSRACVSNITVRDVKIQNTLTGLRIKTWQGGSGSVQNVAFSNIEVEEVKTPIVIDQYYCDDKSNKCRNESSAVSVSDITFSNIRGTFTAQPLRISCSDSFPCTALSLNSIHLIQSTNSTSSSSSSSSFCWEAYGDFVSVPPIDCLRTGKPLNATVETDQAC